MWLKKVALSLNTRYLSSFEHPHFTGPNCGKIAYENIYNGIIKTIVTNQKRFVFMFGVVQRMCEDITLGPG